MTVFLWLSCSLAGLGLIGLSLAVARFKLAKLDMTFLEFARRLIRGGGYKRISPREFEALRASPDQRPLVVDLRDVRDAAALPFPGSVSSPFDEFLKQVVVERKYDPLSPIVLVCDTGQMSRVAANILVEDEGFTNVYNLNGGVARWTRWQRKASAASCCGVAVRLSSCCT
jgi:rhodanese-related sulfurtransferase